MLFPTKKKIDVALSELIARVDRVQRRIQMILDEGSVFDSLLGPSAETEEFKERGAILVEGLTNLQTGLRFDRITARDVNVRLPNAEAMVRNHENLCAMVEAARRSGDAAVNRYFGT